MSINVTAIYNMQQAKGRNRDKNFEQMTENASLTSN